METINLILCLPMVFHRICQSDGNGSAVRSWSVHRFIQSDGNGLSVVLVQKYACFARAHRSHRWGAKAERRQWRMKRGGGVLSKRALPAAAPQGDYCEADRAKRDHWFESSTVHHKPLQDNTCEGFFLPIRADDKNTNNHHNGICQLYSLRVHLINPFHQASQQTVCWLSCRRFVGLLAGGG